MDAFESVVAMLLQREGYWTAASVKVTLTKEEKRRVGRHSSPRWEIDLVAYKGSTNQLLAVECKSFLDSVGVVFRSGKFDAPKRYKLFTKPELRQVVLNRLVAELQQSGACAPSPAVQLCLAAGKIAGKSDLEGMRTHFSVNGWRLFDEDWFQKGLSATAQAGYENDVAFVVAKILLRNRAHAE
jgi:hypothetical protein